MLTMPTPATGLFCILLGIPLLFLGLFGTRLLAWWLERRHHRRPPCAGCPDARCLCHPGRCPFVP
jgi:hypothetical protein